MFTPKAMQAWFTLMAEANKAPDAFKNWPKMPASPEEWQKWMLQFAPNTTAAPNTPEMFEAWLNNWHQAMGVVPRARYLELLEKHDQQQRKLEKAEETIQALRTMLESKEQYQEEAKKTLDMWGTMMEETTKAQGDWMRAWTRGAKKE